MWRYSFGERRLIITFYILHSLASASELLYPVVLAQIINSVQLLDPNEVLSRIISWLWVWIGLFVTFNLFHRLGRYIEFHVAYNAKASFIRDAYRNISTRSVAWHNSHHTGDVLDRINLASSALFNFTTMQFVYVEFFTCFLGSFVALSILVPAISIYTLCTAFIVLLLIRHFDLSLAYWYRVINDNRHKVSATLVDLMSNIITILAYQIQEYTEARLAASISDGYAPNMRAHGFVNALKWFAVTLLMTLLQVLGVFYYVYIQIRLEGAVLAGNITAVYQYIDRFTSTFRSFAQEYQKIIQWEIDMESLADFDSGSHIQSSFSGSTLPRHFRAVEVNDLRFMHDSKRSSIRCSFSFAAGEKIALVGESGCGKSSLLMLLAGLYTPDNADVSIDGQNVESLQSIAAMSTLIPQHPEIFEETILRNITLGRPASEEAIKRALAFSTFDKVLSGLPDGLDTVMSERGASLSGGQKQRLALARGIFHAEDSIVILMDEPTSSVDSSNELSIYTHVIRKYKDNVVIAAVHNMNVTKLFDRICILERGSIIDVGTFRELSKRSNVYRRLLAQGDRPEYLHDI
ncbi:ABC transporter ATP-binding protein [Sinorhizobium prairiense]|nr:MULTISPECIES: ABC transporter ATP-binding protein [unclassified Sinorhizobium]WEJ08769.1 ABC transporter ATP-binding protein/permease [Sinorhizobium sp. M103]WEJ14142.1 ABC transporter ATP-binding protein/permease [Sinorhizobium sp. K101]WEJ35737.1 ABC transporter ATP-binding protein/permease [Sinorhizobium sp. C101]